MSATLRHLCISDVLKIVEDACCDERKQKRLIRMSVDIFPRQFFVDADRNEYLLQIPGEMREDSLHYYFFTEGYLFEIHKADYPNKYSFISFPKALEERRNVIQDRFVSAVIDSGAWMECFERKSWEHLSDELKAYLYPVFIEDDAKPALM